MRTPRHIVSSLIVAASLYLPAHAAPVVQDTPAIDPNQLLQALKALKDQQAQQAKTSRQSVVKAAQSAAATPAAAAAAWIEAVRQTQFEGVEKEGAAFREWKDKEGALFSEKEVQAAAQFYFRWLTITAQHAMGSSTKELLPSIIQYTREVLADAAVVDSMMEHAQKEKERANPRSANARNNRAAADDERVKREHDQILKLALPASPPVKALHAEEVIKGEDKWEMQPGDVDGIYDSIVLPELRAEHDQRALDYWDMKAKLEGDAVKLKPAFDQDKFAKERRPELQWFKAKEYAEIGLRNRGISEMFQVLRANPQHPKFNAWVSDFETMIAPPAATTGATAPPTGTTTGTAATGALPGTR